MQPDKTSITGLFESPLQYLVPIFQRGYVWTIEEQIGPLWEDMVDRIEALERHKSASSKVGSDLIRPLRRHFLGTIVLGKASDPGYGPVTSKEVIDGQQRITTLQLMLLAFRDLVKPLSNEIVNGRIASVTRNAGPYEDPKDHFKVWPTNIGRDEIAEIATLGSQEAVCKRFPIKCVDEVTGKTVNRQRSLMVEAYLYMYGMLGCHLSGHRFDEVAPGTKADEERTLSDVLIRSIRKDEVVAMPISDLTIEVSKVQQFLEALGTCFQVMTLQLDDTDEPQIIFETLNARGAQLYPSDLARNFIFLQAMRRSENVDALYERHWKNFDEKSDSQSTAKGAKYWKQEERQGRLKNSRLDLLLYHYVGLRTQNEIKVAHVFEEFKSWWQSDKRDTATELAKIAALAKHFEMFISPKQVTRFGLFCYRLRALDTATLTPLVLYLLEHHQPDSSEFLQAIGDLESYVVRRYISRMTTQGYNRIFLGKLLGDLVKSGATDANSLREGLLSLSGPSQEWPTDERFEEEWKNTRLYRGGSKAGPRMILEAIEMGMRTPKQEFTSIPEGLSIEHVMPQKWQPEHWPLSKDTVDVRADRNRLLHTPGNLTLLSQPLNSSVSNGPFRSKRGEIAKNSQLILNAHFQKLGDDDPWSEDQIRARSDELYLVAKRIWPRP